MDELNRFCSFNKLPTMMQIRLREYYIKRKQVSLAESRQEVAEGLSPMLQGEVAWQVNHGWLERIPFLNRDVAYAAAHPGHASHDPEMQRLRVEVALALRPHRRAGRRPDRFRPAEHAACDLIRARWRCRAARA